MLSGVVVREASNNGVEAPSSPECLPGVGVLRFAQDDTEQSKFSLH
jgi:hypothetical protein